MNIKVFTANNIGKVEFTKCELEKLLNQTYADGFKAGEESVLKANIATYPINNADHAIKHTHPNVASDNGDNGNKKTFEGYVELPLDPAKLKEMFTMPLEPMYPNEAIANLTKELGLR